MKNIERFGYVVAAIALVALIVASWATAVQPFDDWPAFTTPGTKLLAYYSYFTIWSTILSIVFALTPLGRSTLLTVLRINAVTMIVVTGIIYNFVLTHDPYTSVFAVTSPIMHTLLPVAIPLLWLLTIRLRGRADVRLRTIALSLVVPVIWTIWMFSRGAITGGFYPYSIVDVTELGLPTVLRNVVLVYGFFFVLAAVMAGVERLILKPGSTKRNAALTASAETTTAHPRVR